MLWLQPFPLGRWLLAGLIVLAAVWVEFRPDPTVEHPFAVERIQSGDDLSSAPIEMRRIPAGLLEPVNTDAVALRTIEPGEPLMATSVGPANEALPEDWWVLEIELPSIARRGQQATLILLDSDSTVEGVILTAGSEDAFGSPLGAVAVPPEDVAEVASAAANGRVVVMIRGG